MGAIGGVHLQDGTMSDDVNMNGGNGLPSVSVAAGSRATSAPQEQHGKLNASAEPAFARIVGADFCADLHSLPTFLGRKLKDSALANSDNTIAISGLKIVSRRHAIICWDNQRRTFTIESLSKNGIEVNSENFSGQTDPIPLSNRTRLVIGGVVCFFLLPSLDSVADRKTGNGTSVKDPIVLSSDEEDDEHMMDYF